jgi:hypothetical protein
MAHGRWYAARPAGGAVRLGESERASWSCSTRLSRSVGEGPRQLFALSTPGRGRSLRQSSRLRQGRAGRREARQIRPGGHDGRRGRDQKLRIAFSGPLERSRRSVERHELVAALLRGRLDEDGADGGAAAAVTGNRDEISPAPKPPPLSARGFSRRVRRRTPLRLSPLSPVLPGPPPSAAAPPFVPSASARAHRTRTRSATSIGARVGNLLSRGCAYIQRITQLGSHRRVLCAP